MNDLPFAYPELKNTALFRQQPEHFQVNEVLSFKPEGKGDHLYLRMKKRDTNTDWLARELAEKAGLRSVDVGYAGRKDRFAVTTQWFSLHLPESKMVDITIFQNENYQVIEHTRHTKKLRKGEITCNEFKLLLTDFKGSFTSFEQRVQLIAKQGYPNYFGPQRFGHEGGNVEKARNMLSGKLRINDRNKRSIYLSAARSYLFNLVLAERIVQNCWRTPINGDRFWDAGDTRLSDCFDIANSDDDTFSKLEKGILTITGPMPGDGDNSVVADCLALETKVLATDNDLYKGIANSRVQWSRRPLRIIPRSLKCAQTNDGIELSFSLASGAYATSLLRELIE